jgi:hypothetical protein
VDALRTSISYERLAPGLAGVMQTLPKMERLVAAAVRDPRVRRATEWVVRDAKGGDRIAEARAIFNFVLARVRYTRDPSDMEFVQEPQILLERIQNTGWAAGDCDDHALLIAAMGHSIRLTIVWVLAGPSRATPEHIYAAMALPGQDLEAVDALVALDTASPNATFGRHAPAQLVRWAVPALKGL